MGGSFCGAVLGQSAQILSRQRLPIPLSHAVDCGLPVLHTREFLRSGPWAVSSNSQPTALAHTLVTCSRPGLACAPRKGVFVEQSLGSQLKFSVGSACLSPCHTQLTAACLCSTQGSLCGAVLGQSAQILSGQRLSIPLSHIVDRGLPVLHAREFLRSGPWAVSSNSQQTALAHTLVTCSRPGLACAPRKGVFVEQSLGSQLKFSADSACPPPCHTQSTVACLCSTRERFLERSLGSQLKFSADSARPAPCHKQATASRMCSM